MVCGALGEQGASQEAVAIFPNLWPQLCGGRSRHAVVTVSLQGRLFEIPVLEAIQSFSVLCPQHQAYGTWSVVCGCVCVCVCVCVCDPTLGGEVGRLLLSWCSDASILEYLGVHGLLLGYFPSPSF